MGRVQASVQGTLHSRWCSVDETGSVCSLKARRRLSDAIPCQIQPSLAVCYRAS
jgi:hypothetical protein